MEQAKREEVGALWKRTSKDGKEYYGGKIFDKDVVAFPVGNKKNENQPDLRVYRSRD